METSASRPSRAANLSSNQLQQSTWSIAVRYVELLRKLTVNQLLTVSEPIAPAKKVGNPEGARRPADSDTEISKVLFKPCTHGVY